MNEVTRKKKTKKKMKKLHILIKMLC